MRRLLLLCVLPSLPACSALVVVGEWDAGPLELRADPEMSTLVHARWRLDASVNQTGLEYRFDDGDWMATPLRDGFAGAHEEPLLGIPPDTEVEVRVVAVGGEAPTGSSATVRTGTLPDDLPTPTVVSFDESRAYEALWFLSTIDAGADTFAGPYYVQIFDRDGRIVWYREIREQLAGFYSAVARDGTHIWYDESTYFDLDGSSVPGITRMTLDGRYLEEIEVSGYHLGVDEAEDGAFVYEFSDGSGRSLHHIAADGEDRLVWDCAAYFDSIGADPSGREANTVIWDEQRNTAFYSMFTSDTVIEVDIATGEPIKQFGQLPQGPGWTFDPPESVVDYQHYVNWTPDGHILASTHILDQSGVQAANEYEVDEEAHTLRVVWQYTTSERYATHTGEANRLPNGNTLIGYGTGGALRELAGDEVVFEMTWPTNGSDMRFIGHTDPILDLYALNEGPG